MEFTGKVIVITGASSGIGRAAALAFAAEGAKVALGARRADECRNIVEQIEARGGEACFTVTDVGKAAEVKGLVDAAIERWGRLDMALNNAGIEGAAYVSTADYPEDVWNQVLATNLTGIFLAMKYEIPHIAKQGGSIVNMSSIAGYVGGPIGIGYHASKHGVIGATKSAALEYAASGIRVNAVCPAVTETDMASRLFHGNEAAVKAAHPLGRFAATQEVVDAVLWLCSERSSFVTGVALPVDGGYLAK